MADAVVIGAGPNGLIAATRLARAGRSVILCERTSEVGGLVGRGLLPHTRWTSPKVLRDAGVAVEWRAPADLHGVRDGSLASVRSAGGWAEWQAFCDAYRGMARSFLTEPAPRLRSDGAMWPVAKAALGVRRLGAPEMMTLLRVAPVSAEDALSEHIPDPAARAAIAGASLLGTWMGPLSPTGGAILLLDQILSGQEVQGGGRALARALERAARDQGVDIRTQADVQRIRIDDGGVTGVIASGESIDARTVVACCDPRSALLTLCEPQRLPVRTEYQAQEHRVRGLVAVVHLDLAASAASLPELLHTATHPHDVERAFDEGKNRTLPPRLPVLLRREEGRATVWLHGIAAGVASTAQVLELALASLSEVWPTVRDDIIGHDVWTPDRLESELGLAGGHLWHGELALDQLWSLRPGLDLSGHRSPVPGLYLGSGGTHPVGGATGIPGWLAAGAALEGV